jgi:hypothetical protein
LFATYQITVSAQPSVSDNDRTKIKKRCEADLKEFDAAFFGAKIPEPPSQGRRAVSATKRPVPRHTTQCVVVGQTLSPARNKVIYDYTADGAKRSIHDSLKRLNVDHIDFVWVHDIAQDFHGDGWLGMFDTARKGAFVALSQLRDQGVIKGWGLGVNKVQPVELLLDLAEVKPDATLLAGRYSLLDHELALQRLMPAGQRYVNCRARSTIKIFRVISACKILDADPPA